MTLTLPPTAVNTTGTWHLIEDPEPWRKTIVVDLDGTICRSVDRDYDNALPILPVIDRLNKLVERGWHVKVFTGRGMITFDGDVRAIEIRWRHVVQTQLKKWGLNYHELIFGKPAGEHYLDDKALTLEQFTDDFVEKSRG